MDNRITVWKDVRDENVLVLPQEFFFFFKISLFLFYFVFFFPDHWVLFGPVQPAINISEIFYQFRARHNCQKLQKTTALGHLIFFLIINRNNEAVFFYLPALKIIIIDGRPFTVFGLGWPNSGLKPR